jgi:uncharacterized membrane protein YeaQ/YmgE (transglycosylase-associated protein family)
MEIKALLLFLLIGALAGWLAGKIMRGGGFGLIGNMVLGVVGALVGGYLFNLVDVAASGFLGSLITATVGAIVVLFVVGLFKRS